MKENYLRDRYVELRLNPRMPALESCLGLIEKQDVEARFSTMLTETKLIFKLYLCI